MVVFFYFYFLFLVAIYLIYEHVVRHGTAAQITNAYGDLLEYYHPSPIRYSVGGGGEGGSPEGINHPRFIVEYFVNRNIEE